MSGEEPSPEVQILKAVQQLDSKLSSALNRQTETLTASIRQLADRHTESLIAQEKRNATFADRDRVEAVAEHQHTIGNLTQTLILRVTATEKRLAEVAAELVLLRESISQKAESFLVGANGYLVTFLIMLIIAVASAVVGRAVR